MNALIAAATFYEVARTAGQSRFAGRNIASRFLGYNLTVLEMSCCAPGGGWGNVQLTGASRPSGPKKGLGPAPPAASLPNITATASSDPLSGPSLSHADRQRGQIPD